MWPSMEDRIKGCTLSVCLSACVKYLTYLSFTQNWNAIESSYGRLLLALVNDVIILRSKDQRSAISIFAQLAFKI